MENGYQLLSSNHSVNIIFDTGTNFIFLPFEYVQEMKHNLSKIGCKIIEFNEASKTGNNFDKLGFKKEFRLVCSSFNLPNIQFVLGNTTFMIPNHLTFYYEGGYAYSYILFVLADKNAKMFVGYDSKTKSYTRNKRVSVVKGNYVVVIQFYKDNHARFITAYVADKSIDKITKGPEWHVGIIK